MFHAILFMLHAVLRRLRSHSVRANKANRPSLCPTLEGLEDRYAPAVLMVTTNADAGPGSLRAIVAASNNGDVIHFAPGISDTTITFCTFRELPKSIED